MMWDSADANSATISIIRLPIAHGGGLIGIASIEMVAAERARPWD
jgi:presenilin-like A22 family membrane protease